MGSKSHLNFQSDRPESGGANRDDEREKSRILEREEELLTREEAKARRERKIPGAAEEDRADRQADRLGSRKK
jgi:hypothetical protein